MKKPKSFDFSKKPISPCFLMSVAKGLISFPDLRKRKFKLEKINMEGVEGPYLMLVTHSSMVDFNIMLNAYNTGIISSKINTTPISSLVTNYNETMFVDMLLL